MLKKISILTVMFASAASVAVSQDRSGCNGIYCPQSKASDFAAEFQPYLVPGKTWQQQKGKNVLIMKYYTPSGTVAQTKTYPQNIYMKPIDVGKNIVAFAGNGTPTVAIYGLQPCAIPGEFAYKGESFTCASLWQDRLAGNLFGTRAVLCRAYIDQLNRPVQQATCIREKDGFDRDHTPGGIVIDDALVGLGVVEVGKGADGKALRPDLAAAVKSGATTLQALAR